MQVLVVDDSQFSRLYMRRLLAGFGYDVQEAASGPAALEILRSAPPDCLILDLLMPGMGGFEVMDRLRKAGSAVPVVVLTADIQKTTERRCLDLGASAVIHKPCNQEQLEAVLGRVLGEQRR